ERSAFAEEVVAQLGGRRTVERWRRGCVLERGSQDQCRRRRDLAEPRQGVRAAGLADESGHGCAIGIPIRRDGIGPQAHRPAESESETASDIALVVAADFLKPRGTAAELLAKVLAAGYELAIRHRDGVPIGRSAGEERDLDTGESVADALPAALE